MACRLVSAKPLSEFEPVLICCQLDPWEQTSVKYQWEFKHFHSRKCIGKCCLQNSSHLVSASMCYCPQFLSCNYWWSLAFIPLYHILVVGMTWVISFPAAHFMSNVFIVIQIWWKFLFSSHWSHCYEVLHMTRQLCCCGSSKIWCPTVESQLNMNYNN